MSSQNEVKWDTGSLQDKASLLRKSAETLRTLNSVYADLGARIEENWTGAAATVYKAELSIDTKTVDTLADNIGVLSDILTRASADFDTCATEVSTDMQIIEEQLNSIK